MDDVRVHIVDREDQVKWYLDPKSSHSFCLQLDKNHHELRQWLLKMCQGVAVVSGKGTLPMPGGVDHPTRSIFENIQRDQWKVYFENEADAIAFKLAWGGSL